MYCCSVCLTTLHAPTLIQRRHSLLQFVLPPSHFAASAPKPISWYQTNSYQFAPFFLLIMKQMSIPSPFLYD